MRTLRLSTALATLFLLASAQDSYALVEWIHKLSGPGGFWGLRARLDCNDGRCLRLWEVPVDGNRVRWIIDATLAWEAKNGEDGHPSLFILEPGVERWIHPRVAVGSAFVYIRTRADGTGPNRDKIGVSTRITYRSRPVRGGLVLEAGFHGTWTETRFTPEEFGLPADAFEAHRFTWGLFFGPRWARRRG